jgi:hypothetical protein
MKPQLNDRGYDNVLRGQGYRTPQGTVKDRDGAMVEWWLAGERSGISERYLLPRRISRELSRDANAGPRSEKSALWYNQPRRLASRALLV